MDNKKENKKSVDENPNIDDYINKIELGNIEMTMNIKKQNNPVELLEKLYLLRNNKKLSNEDKNKEVQKIMNEYMR
ncbi:hypothetical protein [Anaerosalibacter massiliensis]|uniref:Uncharacterized protein n=1 Tax=Anaerosalibacter massiliensis TaxID=1347392 RepID=A0A9X2MGN8_9FIRM|nr:hypothetical protein [Anaerosalibacter massiliensis]MCR2042852.1 hypothetical protein [Anaerosalibacter massiliensis]